VSEPVQVCQLCGRTRPSSRMGEGFLPVLPSVKLRRACEAAGCACEPKYTAGLSPGLLSKLKTIEEGV
jgi:hypothetical protein